MNIIIYYKERDSDSTFQQHISASKLAMSFQQLTHTGAKSISIQAHVANYVNQHLNLPPWQRKGQKIWEGEYKSDLIESIMSGIDIPKLYLGLLNSLPERPLIIDGGHRTRCLVAYMENKFPWENEDGTRVFYSEVSTSTRASRVMTNEERAYFDNYQLTIITYVDIDEKQARTIFNRLQNAAPMAMADVVNSYESDLIDFFRDDVRPWLLNGNEDYKHHKGLPLKHPDTNEDIYQMLSWFTIINPEENHRSLEENALMNIEMGKSRENNLCFKYLRNFDDSSLTQQTKNKFKATITSLMSFLERNPKMNNLADIATYIYSIHYLPQFSEDMFRDFLAVVVKMKALENEAKKKFKTGQQALANAKQDEKNNLNAEYEGKPELWLKSKAQNGMKDANMRIRNDIVRIFCLEDGEQEEVEEYIEGEDIPRA